MTNLQCMSFTSKSNGEILVAGCQDTMFVIDVNKGEIVKQVSGLSGPVQTCVRPGPSADDQPRSLQSTSTPR